MVDTFALKNPVPMMIRTRPVKKVKWLSAAMVKWPSEMMIPPMMSDFAVPRYRSASHPPRIGVRYTRPVYQP